MLQGHSGETGLRVCEGWGKEEEEAGGGVRPRQWRTDRREGRKRLKTRCAGY